VSDYETVQKERNVIVGIFVVAAICALVWLIFIFNDLPTIISQLRSFQVYVQFPTAPGVLKDTPVRFCGYPIGRVTEVMSPIERTDLKTKLKYYQTVVILSISDKYKNIPSNVEVKLMTRGLGSSYIELLVDPTLPLVRQDPNKPGTEYLVDEMWLQGSTGVASEFFSEDTQKKMEEFIDGLRDFIKHANEIISDEGSKENIRTTLANLSDASEQLDKFLASGVGTSEEIGKTVKELRVVLEKINEGEGSAGKLVNDGRLYESLVENTQQMQLLLEELEIFVAKANEKGLPIKLK